MSEPSTPTNSLEKRAVRTSPVLWIFGALLALLLSSIGTRALFDLADVFPEPMLSTYEDPRLTGLAEEERVLADKEAAHQRLGESASGDLATLERTLQTAEENWRSWLATRATLGGSGAEDKEVRARRDRLDALRAERDAAQRKVTALQTTPPELRELRADLEARRRAALSEAEREYDAARRVYELRLLGMRLGVLLPVVGLGLFFWRRRQTSKYPTLLWGYWAFTLWLLGIGIYPYLPHYGGYAPLLGGVGLVWWGSVSLVRYFNRRAPARRRRIVDLAIARHRCPGCERDYLVGRETDLSLGVVRKATTRHFDGAALQPRACPGCGLELFAPCAKCHAVQVVHLDHCASCGAPWVSAPLQLTA